MTDDGKPVLNQINLVVSDMDASIDFYRRLGLDVPDGGAHDGIRHVEIEMARRRAARARQRDARADVQRGVAPAGGGQRALIGFSLPIARPSTTSTPSSPRMATGACRFRSTRSGGRGTRSSPIPTATSRAHEPERRRPTDRFRRRSPRT